MPLPTATLGVEDFDQNAFVMYPNPVNNQLNFEFSTLDIDELKVSITDMQGRIVLNNQIKTSTNTIDVSGLSTGLYQVIIMDENDILMTKKLIKN